MRRWIRLIPGWRLGSLVTALMFSQVTQAQTGGTQQCAPQAESIKPGIYAAALQETITLSNNQQQMELGAGRTGFADQPGLSCYDEIPEFISRDRLPIPANYGAGAQGCGFGGGGSGGATNFGIDSDWPQMERRFAEKIENFVSNNYPATSIIVHALASGLTIDKAIYLMTRADRSRAEEFFRTAYNMQSSLPGWVCSSGAGGAGDAYSQYYDVNDLPPRRLVRDVADRYFDEQQIMEPFPDWFSGDFHMLAWVDELIELSSENESHWYEKAARQSVADNGLQKPILISLYADTEDVVLDISRDDLELLKSRGAERLPVVFYYNKDYQRPVGEFEEDPELDEVLDAFHSRSEELTPVPLLASGDFHFNVELDEFDDLFEIPEVDDIDPERFDALTRDLQTNGFNTGPVVVTAYSGSSSSWLDDPERVRAAMELNMETAPTAVLFHREERMACSAVPNCIRRMCQALTCAGGSPDACEVEFSLSLGREEVENDDPPSSFGGVPPGDDPPPDDPPPDDPPPDDPPPDPPPPPPPPPDDEDPVSPDQ